MIKQDDDDDDDDDADADDDDDDNANDYSVINKIYLNIKNPNEVKYQYLIKNCRNLEVLIECSNNMQGIYKSIDEYNPSRKCYVLIAFDDMIADIISKKKLNQIVTEVFIKVIY